MTGDDERVVLVDESGRAVGTAAKATVHGPDTPLHLAFSCYVVDDDERLLLTRRALDKPTWPGAWTNSFCGHPGRDEPIEAAVHRRAADELGLRLFDVRLLLPTFRYRARMEDGTVENELCPVFVARAENAPRAVPAEVADLAWVDWAGFRDDVAAGRREVAPWCREQVALLPAHLHDAPRADPGLLPPAAVIDHG